MSTYESTKVFELGSCAFRQWKAVHSHCRFIHGYQLKAKIWFGCKTLDEKNWCVDFGDLKDLKKIFQEQFDHTLCVAKDDPHVKELQRLHTLGVVDIRIMDAVGCERTAQWIFEKANDYIDYFSTGRCWVSKVEVFEHPDNSAVYTLTNANLDQQNVLQPLTVDEIPVIIPEPSEPQRHSTAAAVGNQVSSGKGDWFAGTSWGNQ